MKGAMTFDQIAILTMQKIGGKNLNRAKHFEAE